MGLREHGYQTLAGRIHGMMTAQRVLIYIPIRHSPEDMGVLGRKLIGTGQAPADTAEDWARVDQAVRMLNLNWPRVRVYQDGLPDTSQEVIDRILAEVQSPNYDLLRWLVKQGATLVGTEEPGLLREEYGYLKAILDARDDRARRLSRDLYARRAVALLASRDKYIAHRIDSTLLPGETGILFIGMAHRLASQLPRDIPLRVLLSPEHTR